MEATTQQQATYLISIQDLLKQQTEIVKSLSKAVEKNASAPNLCGLSDLSWLPLLQSYPHLPATSFLPALRSLHISSTTPSKLIQHVSLAAKLLIDYGLVEIGDPPKDKSIKAQCALRGMFNDWINISAPLVEEGIVMIPGKYISKL